MTFAVLSDIHSNLEALNSVLEDIEKAGIKRIVFLGDIVGYGANPLEVLELSKGFSLRILGNHDEALFNKQLTDSFNPAAEAALYWTKRILVEAGKRKDMDEIGFFPKVVEEKGKMFMHGDHKANSFYLQFYGDAEPTFDCLRRKNLKVGFFGHTHMQGYFHEQCRILKPLPPKVLVLEDFKKDLLLVNPGSVGQPRDGDPKAAYLVCDEEKIEFKRVSYDIRKAAAKIRAIREIPDSLAFRLLKGA